MGVPSLGFSVTFFLAYLGGVWKKTYFLILVNGRFHGMVTILNLRNHRIW